MVCITVDTYGFDYRSKWEKFINLSENGTLFHRQQFLDYHSPERFRSHHLIFRKQNHVLALLPAVIKETKRGKELISHAGASYGGFVLRQRLGIWDCSLLVEAFVQYLHQDDFQWVELTPPPLFYSVQPTNNIDFALLKNGFRYVKRELTSVVQLPEKKENVLSVLKSEARTAIRKAQKMGVVVEESDKYEEFYHILRDNLRMRHDVAPTHTLEELLRLKEMLPDEIRLFSAYVKNEQVAGVVLFLCNPRVMLAFYISHREEHQQYRPVNVLFYHIMEWGRRRSFRYLDFGTFTLNMEPNWGLGKFKETFGARGLFRDTYFLDLSKRD